MTHGTLYPFANVPESARHKFSSILKVPHNLALLTAYRQSSSFPNSNPFTPSITSAEADGYDAYKHFIPSPSFLKETRGFTNFQIGNFAGRL